MEKLDKDSVFDALKKYTGGFLKKKLIELAVKDLTRLLFSSLPFLAWGPLAVVVRFVITNLVIKILDKTIIGAHVLYIYGDTTFDLKKVEKIIQKINKLKKGVSDAEKEMLDKELAAASRELIRFGTL